MPIGVLGFQNYNDTENIRNPLSNALRSGMQTYNNLTNTIYAPKEKEAALQGKLFANKIAEAKAQYARPMALAELQNAQEKPELTKAQVIYERAKAMGVPSEIAERMAQAAHIQSQTAKQNTLNPFVAEREKAEIANINSEKIFRENGGGANRGSTASQDRMIFENSVGVDNPQIKDRNRLRQATNILMQGGDKFPDGEHINPMSPLTKQAYDVSIRPTTTAKLITAGAQANQADVELKAMVSHVVPVLRETGTTYGNKSPDQIIAAFSNTPESQKKLGRIIGARSLQYAIAQLRNRIDMGEPGIGATKELMDNSGQIVDVYAPRLTAEAREEAQKFVDEGVRKALAARNSYGIGASSATGNVQSNNMSDPLGIR